MRFLILVTLCAACIERPFDAPLPQPRRAVVDRAQLRDVLIPAPADAVAVGAVFGNAAELVGYKLEPAQLVPGQRQRMTLYWRCRAEMEAWHIFVHLEDASGSGERIHAEHDPAQGRFPTDSWKPGDTIADSFNFVAGKDPLILYLGFYSSGEARLPITAPGRGRDDGTSRLLAGLLPLAH
ncbi:MAG TPA: hypothetical protein VH083_09300 [Myxococcales bacterium]|nr:hypothetical protein [Myxococcales bacterium]